MRIPVGNFGNAVAAPQQAVNVPGSAFGVQAGADLAQAGRQVSGIADEGIRALTQAKTLRTMAETKNGLFTLADEINQGIEKGDIDPQGASAAWEERSKKFMDDRLSSVNPEMRQTVSTNLLDTTFRLTSGVRDAANKRVQQNVGGELEQLGIQLERESDPAKATALYGEAVRTLGPQAGWSPAQIAKNENTFREKSYATLAYTLVNGARNSMGGLNQVEERLNSDEFSALDPQRRAALLNQTTGFKTSLEQRAVAAAQRAEVAAAKRDREASSTYNQMWGLVMQGRKLDDASIQALTTKTAGTEYANMVPQLLKSVPEATAFAMQPLSTQRAAIDAMQAEVNSSGTSPVKDERLTRMTQSYEAAQRDYKAEPLRAAVERGVLPELAPLDMAGGVAGIVAGVGARMEQARTVQMTAGRPVSPLMSEEAGQLAGVLKALPNDQKATTIAALSSTLGASAMGALAAQLDSKDRTLGLVAAYGDTRGPNGGLVSESILRGRQAIDDKVVKEADVSDWRAEIAKEVRGAYASTEMEDAVIDAAVLARADAELRREGRSVRKAIDTVTGGIIEFNGGKIPLPQGMQERDFEKAITGITPETLGVGGEVFVNGTSVPVDTFVRSLPSAKLRHAGQGVYTVTADTGSVLDGNGRPVMIRMGAGSQSAAPPTEPGQIAPGNINLNNRPVVKNADGSISTVRSMSIEVDGSEVLIPTVSESGKIMTDEQAIKQYRKTGKHLGMFRTPEDATAYAEKLHNDQTRTYGTR